jgi:hypothetical protein
MNDGICVPQQETTQRYPEELVVLPLPAHPKQLNVALIGTQKEKSSSPQTPATNPTNHEQQPTATNPTKHKQQPTAANQTKPKQQLHNKKDENRPYYGALVHKARSQNLSEPTPFEVFVYEPEITDSHI